MSCPCGPDLVRLAPDVATKTNLATCLCCWAKWDPQPDEFYPLYSSKKDAGSIKNAGDCPHQPKSTKRRVNP